jgi:hypothetical protein
MTTKDSYYANFANYVIHEKTNEKNQTCPNYTYQLWCKDPHKIHDLTIVEIKQVLKAEGCRVSGKRQELVKRLTEHYGRIQSIIVIQKTFRGFVGRESERLRGPGYKELCRCVNETDFQTMDSVAEIPRESFFSYEDDGGFVYGFNVFSLMNMFKRNRKFANPYNREDIPIAVVCRIFSLYKKIEILYPLAFSENRLENPRVVEVAIEDARRDAETFEGVVVPDTFDLEVEAIETFDLEVEAIETFDLEASVSVQDAGVEEEYHSLPLNTRIHDIFERIQSLIGGEVNPDWFLSLSQNELDRFYHFYHVWWTRSSSLSDEEKRNICATSDPFVFLSQIEPNWAEALYRRICLELMEWMVFTGTNANSCAKGAEHIIMILCIVSRDARRTRPELFDRLS